jgi:hypothetical protein
MKAQRTVFRGKVTLYCGKIESALKHNNYFKAQAWFATFEKCLTYCKLFLTITEIPSLVILILKRKWRKRWNIGKSFNKIKLLMKQSSPSTAPPVLNWSVAIM